MHRAQIVLASAHDLAPKAITPQVGYSVQTVRTGSSQNIGGKPFRLVAARSLSALSPLTG